MENQNTLIDNTLKVRRTFKASRDKVFRAWTEPDELKRWWRASEDMTTTITEVDLRVGGKYRLGMKPTDKEEAYISNGTYKEVLEPEKLVYTIAWEHAPSSGQEMVVTVEFLDQSEETEVALTHEFLPDTNSLHLVEEGWNGCLDLLAKVVE